MIVVDTSVWVDLFADRDTAPVRRFEELVAHGSRIGLTGVIRMELLQGAPSDQDAVMLDAHLARYPVLDLKDDDYEHAAALYRGARAAGLTVRRQIDCLIAAPCIRAHATLLHADADFDKIASTSALRVVDTG